MHEPAKTKPALHGIRVADFSRMLPGPWCTQMLADLGADVVKIEQPDVGDLGRHNAPNFKNESVYFHTVNLGKRSIDLDLANERDFEIAKRIIASSDVVVESFRAGVAARLGIGYEAARALNPNIIYCSISGYGQTGPYSKIPGHDLVIQATSGGMGTRPDVAVPPNPGFQAGDYAAATYAVIAILAALHRRKESGAGSYLDISMFDCLVSMSNVLANASLAHLAGYADAPAMELWGRNPRYTTYPTKDGKAVAVSLLETRIWKAFCTLIGREDLVSGDETPKDRHSSHGERAALYREAIAKVCLSRPRDELVSWFLENDVPIMPVYTPDEAVSCDHAKARNLIEWIDHPAEGRIPVFANPLAPSGLTLPRRPAPALGADRDAIIAELNEPNPSR